MGEIRESEKKPTFEEQGHQISREERPAAVKSMLLVKEIKS